MGDWEETAGDDTEETDHLLNTPWDWPVQAPIRVYCKNNIFIVLLVEIAEVTMKMLFLQHALIGASPCIGETDGPSPVSSPAVSSQSPNNACFFEVIDRTVEPN